MKKVLSIILSLAMVFTLSCTAFAEESAKPEATITTSEYSMVQKLKTESTEALLAEGYSISDIKSAKSGELEQTIIDELMERAKLSDEILKQKGYTTDEIKQLRSLTGDESLASVQGLLASVSVRNSKSSYFYRKSDDRTYFIINVGWNWDKEPTTHWTDIVGAGWAGNYQLTNKIASTNNTLKLTCVGNGPTVASKSIHVTMKSDDINAGEAIFKMNQGAYYNQSFYWVKSGRGTIELSMSGHHDNAEFIFKYGHSTVSVTPSVSMDGLSLSFSFGVNTSKPSSGAVYGGKAAVK